MSFNSLSGSWVCDVKRTAGYSNEFRVSTALAAHGSATNLRECTDREWSSFNSLSGSWVCDRKEFSNWWDAVEGFNSLSGSWVCDGQPHRPAQRGPDVSTALAAHGSATNPTQLSKENPMSFNSLSGSWVCDKRSSRVCNSGVGRFQQP